MATKLGKIVKYAALSVIDPTNPKNISSLSELSISRYTLQQHLKKRMLTESDESRKVLRDRELLWSENMPKGVKSVLKAIENKNQNEMDEFKLSEISGFPVGSFGCEYSKFLYHQEVSPDGRPNLSYNLEDGSSLKDMTENQKLSEDNYIMIRYRQVHDFLHTLCDLPVSYEAELVLKWFEYCQTRMEMNFLAGMGGWIRLIYDGKPIISCDDQISASADSIKEFFNYALPWAIYAGTNASFIMGKSFLDKTHKLPDGTPCSIFYKPINELRKELNIVTYKQMRSRIL